MNHYSITFSTTCHGQIDLYAETEDEAIEQYREAVRSGSIHDFLFADDTDFELVDVENYGSTENFGVGD